MTVVLAAVLSFIFGRLGASSEGKRAHERWLREQRYEAYKVFLATADKWSTRAKGPDADAAWEPGQDFYDEMTAAESAVELLAPPPRSQKRWIRSGRRFFTCKRCALRDRPVRPRNTGIDSALSFTLLNSRWIRRSGSSASGRGSPIGRLRDVTLSADSCPSSLPYRRGMGTPQKRVTLIVDMCLAITGAAVTLLYLFQPWRTCSYDDAAAACSMLPGDAAVMILAMFATLMGALLVISSLLQRRSGAP